MKDTDKEICRYLAALLAARGVKDVVLSPGSRNAPMSLAATHRSDLRTLVVVDERSAAFIALGMAATSCAPVALVCTSGSAVLNYAPAVAEAYYRHIPLIVVSADRPEWLVDTDEPQTIRQAGILGNIVKHSCDIGVNDPGHYSRRLLMETVSAAISGPCGPVHINLQIDAPLGNLVDAGEISVKLPEDIAPEKTLSTPRAREIGAKLASPRRVLVAAGFLQPDEKVNRALKRLAAKPNIAVVAEPQSNLHGPFITNADSVLAFAGNQPDDSAVRNDFAPDIVLRIGGKIVSGRVRTLIHNAPEILDIDDVSVLPALASAVQPYNTSCDYSALWHEASASVRKTAESFGNECPWSDFKAMHFICTMMPRSWNVHLSNGSTVRYAQIFGLEAHRVDSNRGVSGIDGCTSTAVGASLVYPGVTLLITGDMSAQYDMAAFAATCVTPRFKMIVLNNSGGDIFRFIPQTASQPECEELFAADVRLPLANLCRGYGFSYYEASDETELCSVFARFAMDDTAPAVLNVLTPSDMNAPVLKSYYQNLR